MVLAGVGTVVIEQVERSPVAKMFGINVDALTMQDTIDVVGDMVRSGRPHQHVVVNAAKIVALHDDERLRDIIRSCDLVNADGTSVVLAGRILGQRVPERVTGIDLFLELVREAAAEGWSVYLLGATDEVVTETAAVLTARHPGLRIAGFHHGFWSDDDEMVRSIRDAAPQLLFLAIPSPRKEHWLSQHLVGLGVPFVMGVGGSFDIVAGKTRRAPVIAQRLGMEWLFRLIQEPRRMLWRYARGNTRFVALTAREWWRNRT